MFSRYHSAMLAETLITLFGLLAIPAAQASGSETFTLNSLPVAKYVSPMLVPPQKKDPDSLGVETSARSAAIIDVASGQVLFEKDGNTPFPVASLTKLMTAMAFLDQKPNLDEEFAVLPEDLTRETRPVFAPNERLTKRDMLHALLVGSVNEMGNALVRSLGDRETFVQAMNAKAKELHMAHAQFFDPTGLNSQNHASAKDVGVAMRAALMYPEIRAAADQQKAEIRGIATGRKYLVNSTNLLLGSFLNKAPYHIVAGKTGSLPEAGFCLAQTTRNQDGNEVIAVVLGSENHFARFADAKALTYWAFQNFEWPKKQARIFGPIAER